VLLVCSEQYGATSKAASVERLVVSLHSRSTEALSSRRFISFEKKKMSSHSSSLAHPNESATNPLLSTKGQL
jgi:hypothetical protein